MRTLKTQKEINKQMREIAKLERCIRNAEYSIAEWMRRQQVARDNLQLLRAKLEQENAEAKHDSNQ